MVLNRLCDPESKLGVLRWVETVALPDVTVTTITHQQLLRSMDALMEQQSAVDAVATPAETKTLLPTLSKVLERFPTVRRLVLIADRGLLSLDHLAALQAIRLANGQALEFILAVPERRYPEFTDLLDSFQREPCNTAIEEVIGERAWNDLRLVIAHDPVTAADQTAKRNARIEALITQGDQWAGKLDDQDDGKKHRGRKLSDSGAKAHFSMPSVRRICRASSKSIWPHSSLATISTRAHGRWRGTHGWQASARDQCAGSVTGGGHDPL